MTARDVTVEGRRVAEAIMLDVCTVTRGNGITTTDPVTGVDTNTGAPEVYSGRCKVQAATPQAAGPEAGDHQFTVERIQLHFPVASSLRTGDVATITESWDPDLIGLVFRLTELGRGTYRTADRWDTELVTA